MRRSLIVVGLLFAVSSVLAAPPESRVLGTGSSVLLPDPAITIPVQATYWSSTAVYSAGSYVFTRPGNKFVVLAAGGGAATNGPSSFSRHSTADGYTWRPVYGLRNGFFVMNTSTSGYVCLSIGAPAATNGGIRLPAGTSFLGTRADGLCDSAVYGAASEASTVFYQEW